MPKNISKSDDHGGPAPPQHTPMMPAAVAEALDSSISPVEINSSNEVKPAITATQLNRSDSEPAVSVPVVPGSIDSQHEESSPTDPDKVTSEEIILEKKDDDEVLAVVHENTDTMIETTTSDLTETDCYKNPSSGNVVHEQLSKTVNETSDIDPTEEELQSKTSQVDDIDNSLSFTPNPQTQSTPKKNISDPNLQESLNETMQTISETKSDDERVEDETMEENGKSQENEEDNNEKEEEEDDNDLDDTLLDEEEEMNSKQLDEDEDDDNESNVTFVMQGGLAVDMKPNKRRKPTELKDLKRTNLKLSANTREELNRLMNKANRATNQPPQILLPHDNSSQHPLDASQPANVTPTAHQSTSQTAIVALPHDLLAITQPPNTSFGERSSTINLDEFDHCAALEKFNSAFNNDVNNDVIMRTEQPREPHKRKSGKKRKAPNESAVQKKRTTRHRIEERDEDGKTAEDRDNESITAALRKADVVAIFANSDAVKAAISSELGQIMDVNREHTDLMKNVAREEALAKLESMLRDTRPGVRRREAEKKKSALEFVERTVACMNSVTEYNKYAYVWQIKPAYEETEITKASILQYKVEISHGRTTVFDTFIRGYMDKDEAGNNVIMVHEGYEKVIALTELAEQFAAIHPKYNTLEEEKKMCDEEAIRQQRQFLSQPADMLDILGLPQMSQPELSSPDAKLSNPFLKIFTVIVCTTSSTIPAKDISLFKIARAEATKTTLVSMRQKTIQARLQLAPFKPHIDELDRATLQKQLAGYKNNDIYRAMGLKDEPFEMLMEVMKEVKDANKQSFMKIYLNARDVSQPTADRELKKLKDGEQDFKDTLKVLQEHTTRAYYILIGKKVPRSNAKIIEERLEPGPDTVATIKWHLNNNRRLDKEKIAKVRYDQELMLKWLESEVNPCLGYVVPQMYTKKDGNDQKVKYTVSFIKYDDLKNDPDILKRRVKSAKTHYTLLFITEATVPQVRAIYPDTNGNSSNPNKKKTYEIKPVSVSCATFCPDGDTGYQDTVSCMMMGGKNGKIWTPEIMNEEMKRLRIANSVNHGAMRRLIFDIVNVNDKQKTANSNNSLLVYSYTPEITAIVAILAMNRVYTAISSQQQLDTFTTLLMAEQKKRTENGYNFKGMETIKKSASKRREEDEAADNDDDEPAIASEDEDREE